MKKIEIIVNGKAYPCAPTMGAMLRFKHETGREITQIDGGSFEDLCVYLWCCVVSASRREGIEFGLSFMDFADSITPEDMEAWSQTVLRKPEDGDGDENGDGNEKKSP